MARRTVETPATLDVIATAPHLAIPLLEGQKHQLRLKAIAALAALAVKPPADETPDVILDAKGAAAFLQTSVNAILRNPKLPRLRTGSRRLVRFSRRKLVEFMERGPR